MRVSEITRNTAETKIQLKLNLDGTGKANIDTGVGFLNHMLTLFAAHGKFDLTVKCEGDVEVDDHHSVEDIGICLGQAFQAALGDKRGILVRHFTNPRICQFNRITIGTPEQMAALIDTVKEVLYENQ